MSTATKIQLSEQQQKELVSRAASRTAPMRTVQRAKLILGLATGQAQKEIAAQLGIVRQTVRHWHRRFVQQGIGGLEDAPRSGRPPVIAPDKIEQIVPKTTQETPLDSTHWSTRSLAQVMGISASSVSRIW